MLALFQWCMGLVGLPSASHPMRASRPYSSAMVLIEWQGLHRACNASRLLYRSVFAYHTLVISAIGLLLGRTRRAYSRFIPVVHGVGRVALCIAAHARFPSVQL